MTDEQLRAAIMDIVTDAWDRSRQIDGARVEADRDAATRIAARALSDRVAEMCNVDKEDHWKYHYDDVLSDTELVISTYLAALAAERKEQA